MSYYKPLDLGGWLRTIEDVTPDPETEKKAIPIVLSCANDAEDGLFLLRMLGLAKHLGYDETTE